MSAPVRLNVYDLIDSKTKARELGKDFLGVLGMGIYHSGVEIYGEEYSFGMDPTGLKNPSTEGVFALEPQTADGVFKESIEVGFTNKSKGEVAETLAMLRPQWMAASYHLLDRNCCHFTKAFLTALDPAFAEKYPKWANRAAGVGSAVVPEALLSSITEALAPPPAIPVELVNKISVVWSNGPAPRPNLPWQETDPNNRSPPLEPATPPAQPTSFFSRGLGLVGQAAGAVATQTGKLASAVKSRITRYIDDRDKEEFEKSFPQLDSSKLLSAYSCNVVHIYRVQRAKIFVTENEIALHGPSKLAKIIPFKDIGSCQYGNVVPPPPEHKQLPPTFELVPADGNGMPQVPPTALLLFAVDGKSFNPVFNLSFIGALGRVAQKHTTPVNAMRYLDMGWRSEHQ